ncbi:MAG: GHKL domain-containing protein [Lachnospiraceae bacterium]|nr:GHKL domain-containing protein [Lachnospiraceae bacterium]
MENKDLYFEAVIAVFEIISYFGTGYLLFRFARPFMENKKRVLSIAIAYFVTMLILYFVLIEMDYLIYMLVAHGLGVLVAFAVMCRIDRRNYKQKIYIAVTFYSLRWQSDIMVGFITQAIYHIKPIYNAYFPPGGNPVTQLMIFGGMELLDIVMDFALLGISVGAIVKTYVYKREDMSIKEMLMLTAPSIAGVTGYGIMIYFVGIGNWMDVFSGLYSGVAFLHFGISIVTIVVVIVLFQNIKARQEEKLQSELLAAQIENTERHIRQVESLYRNIQSMKHDMANHIFTLERLYEGNNVEEAIDYGKELKSALSLVSGEIKSGNPVTDVILLELKNEAEKRNIRFQSDFYYPTGTNINAFDVSVILNNALQNAMENVEKSETPHISVHSCHRNKAYMIEISNSFTGELLWDEERGLPVTSKKTEGHGYGLSNIRMVAKKYFGDIVINLKDDEFCLSVMLMME